MHDVVLLMKIDNEEVTTMIAGSAMLHHSTLEYLRLETQRTTSLLDHGHKSIPTYQHTLIFPTSFLPTFLLC